MSGSLPPCRASAALPLGSARQDHRDEAAGCAAGAAPLPPGAAPPFFPDADARAVAGPTRAAPAAIVAELGLFEGQADFRVIASADPALVRGDLFRLRRGSRRCYVSAGGK